MHEWFSDRGKRPHAGGIVPPRAIDAAPPDYDAAAVEWARGRDVLAGEVAVKARGAKHLPGLVPIRRAWEAAGRGDALPPTAPHSDGVPRLTTCPTSLPPREPPHNQPPAPLYPVSLPLIPLHRSSRYSLTMAIQGAYRGLAICRGTARGQSCLAK